ncbi:MAG: ATP-binding protein [Bryobacteraceae bacterium]
MVRHTGVRGPLRQQTHFAFLWIALVPMVLAAIAMWLSTQFRLESAWIAHTYEVRTQVRDIVQLAVDAEDSLTQYFLTGDQRRSLAIDVDSAQLMLRLEQVRSLTIDNPVQQRNVATLDSFIRETLSQIQEARDLVKRRAAGGSLPPRIAEQADQLMRNIRTCGRGMMEEEERLLLARGKRENLISREVEAVFMAAVVVTLVLLFWAARRLREYAAERDRAESELQHSLRQIEVLNRDLETRVVERTAQLRDANVHLAQSNEDLERLAFIASHDLQEPLRVVTLYSQLLAKSYRGVLDEQGSVCLANIIEATDRMLELLRSLLLYAEIGVISDNVTAPADMNAVLRKVIQNLSTSIMETGAEIASDRLPVLRVGEGHFVQLFQNLISNAIKYRCNRPKIKVTFLESADGLQFAVADNGIGIEREYQEKIFVAFKRLHGRSIPGAGIGLAICKRVLERYGGRIWVESVAGHGATFFFSLPTALKCPDAPLSEEHSVENSSLA